ILLKLNDRVLGTVALYSPELDLLRNDQTGVHPFRLRLFYFARTPMWFVPGSVLELEDRLWPEAPALCSMNALDRNDIQVVPMGGSQLLCNPGARRVLRVRCTGIIKRPSGVNTAREGHSFEPRWAGGVRQESR